MTPEEFIKYFVHLKLRIQDASRKELPLIAGNKAVLLFKHNFKDESFFGEKWLEVKRRMPQATSPTSKGKKKKKKATGAASKRPILTGATGNLDQSIQMRNSDGEKTYAQLLWRSQLLAGTYIFAAYSSVSLSPIIRSM